MAQKSCSSCLRILQRHSKVTNLAHPTSTRAFSTTRHHNAVPAQPAAKQPVTGRQPASHAADIKSIPRKDVNTQKMKNALGGTYSAYGMTDQLYKECAQQADYKMPKRPENDTEYENPKTEDGEDLGTGEGWWHNELGLKPTFSTWSQVTMLHVYILFARFRNLEGVDPKVWQQPLLDHFFFDAEQRMTNSHGMVAQGVRTRYLKDMFTQWRGLIAAYDEGIAKGDAVLAAAIWRNLFKAREDVDIKGLAQIVSYTRRTLSGLDAVPDSRIMREVVVFETPKEEEKVVNLKSFGIQNA